MPATSNSSVNAPHRRAERLTPKPVHFRELAARDLESASGYYLAEAGVETAVRFIDAVESSVKRIGRNPGLGSLRFAYELALPDVRVVAVGRFPYLLFYVERDRSVDVWRLLHSSRDIPASLREPDA